MAKTILRKKSPAKPSLEKKLHSATMRFMIELQRSLSAIITEENTVDCSSMVCKGTLKDGSKFQVQLKVTTDEYDFCDEGYGEVDLSINDLNQIDQ